MDQIISISLFVLFLALVLPRIDTYLSAHPHISRIIKYLILSMYLFANLNETLLFRKTNSLNPIKLQPLWSYRKALQLYGGVAISNSSLLKQIILNILLYIPMGYLLPFVWPGLRKQAPELKFSWRVVLIGFFASLCTELTQLIFRIGWFEIDDILNNTLGCLIGYLLFEIIYRQNDKRTSGN